MYPRQYISSYESTLIDEDRRTVSLLGSSVGSRDLVILPGPPGVYAARRCWSKMRNCTRICRLNETSASCTTNVDASQS
jgi:hypothetical protein